MRTDEIIDKLTEENQVFRQKIMDKNGVIAELTRQIKYAEDFNRIKEYAENLVSLVDRTNIYERKIFKKSFLEVFDIKEEDQ